MRKYNIAIIGIGHIAIEHLKGYQENSDRCTIKYLCNIHKYKAEKFALENKLSNVIIVEDYKELLSRDDLDIVSICLPPSLHKEVTCSFLDNGKHVLCEKPMASSLNEAKSMIYSMNNSNTLLSIVSQNRFKNDVYKVKQLLNSGILGKIIMTRIVSLWYRGDNYYKLWWRGTWDKEGGGCTLNHSIHQIDILEWLLGRPKWVLSSISNLNHLNSKVEDTSLSILKFKDSMAQLCVSLNSHDEKQEFYIECENATISIPFAIKCKKQLETGFPEIDKEKEDYYMDCFNDLDDIPKVGYAGQINNFINAIEGKEELLVKAKDGYNSLELVMAVYESALNKKIINIPINKKYGFTTKLKLINSMKDIF